MINLYSYTWIILRILLFFLTQHTRFIKKNEKKKPEWNGIKKNSEQSGGLGRGKGLWTLTFPPARYYSSVLCNNISTSMLQVGHFTQETDPFKAVMCPCRVCRSFYFPHSNNFPTSWSQGRENKERSPWHVKSVVADHLHAWICKYLLFVPHKNPIKWKMGYLSSERK